MKKLLSIGLIFLSFACQNNEAEIKPDYLKIIQSLESTYREGIQAVKNSPKSNVYEASYDYLKENFYQGDVNINFADFEQKLKNANAKTKYEDIDLSFLTPTQQGLFSVYLNQIKNVNDIIEVSSITNNFNQLVIDSTLPEEQKYQLFTMSTAINVYSEVLIYGIELNDGGIFGGRTKCVDVKGALRAGVLGIITGAAAGAYTGGTAGTVVFPVVGTVTGAVAGGVVGGAFGFLSGVVMSVVQDVVFDC
jgi:hypothetical protein